MMVDKRDRDKTSNGYTSPTFKKLLSSHLSIYNALNNPELDYESEVRQGSPNASRDLNDRFSITSWQSISNESIVEKARPSSSILSSISDDDKEPIAGTSHSKNSAVMVFETDEEDGDVGDDKALSPDLRQDSGLFSANSFVMPKLSMTGSTLRRGKLAVSVLSSSQFTYNPEIINLLKYMSNQFDKNLLQLNHLILSPDMLRFDMQTIRDADLVFLINDGSVTFVECLKRAFGVVEDDSRIEELPKVTIINLITVNYFINLLDLISNLRPYQIWKTSSLKQERLINNMKNFLESELVGFNDGSIKTLRVIEALEATEKPIMLKSLVRRIDYKTLEKDFKRELHISTNIDSIDPLQLSSNFSNIRNILYMLKSVYNSEKSPTNKSHLPGRFWLLCSFAIGIGLGAGFANGASNLINIFFSGGMDFNQESKTCGHLLMDSSYIQSARTNTLDKVDLMSYIKTFSSFIHNSVQELNRSNMFLPSEWLGSLIDSIRYTSFWVLDFIIEGLENLVGIIIL